MDNDEREHFLQAMQDVRPLQRVEVVPPPSPKLRLHSIKARRHQVLAHREEHLIEHWWQHAKDLHTPSERVHAFEHLFYVHPSVSASKLDQLRRGNFTTRCIIDLHGMNEAQASDSLIQWLAHCRLRSDKFALIIHGKGIGSDPNMPILKNFINWWLRNQPRVLAFCSAQEMDGGTGAVYVMIGDAY